MRVWWAALLFPIVASAATEDRVGKIYAVGETDGAPLFTQKIHRVTSDSGHRVSESTIVDSGGKVMMTEKAVLDGSRLVSQDIEQRQIGEAYTLEVTGSKATFRTFKLKDGKREFVSDRTIDAGEDFITGPATEVFLKQRLAGKPEGTKLAVQFGVFEVERPVAFEFVHKGLKAHALKVRLQPGSLLVSMLVSPIDLEVDPSTFTLTHYQGRTPLKRLVNGNWKNFDATILYSGP